MLEPRALIQISWGDIITLHMQQAILTHGQPQAQDIHLLPVQVQHTDHSLCVVASR